MNVANQSFGLSVVIPAYNEAGAIAQTLTEITNTLDRTGRPFELLVVDDGSTDETGALARQGGATVLRHPTNGGYGRALLSGIEAATFDTIVIIDADGTYGTSALPQLLAAYDQGFDMVVGQRQGRHYEPSIGKRGLRTMFRFLGEFACGCSIPDINSGFRVFSRQPVLTARPSLSSGFSFTTTITLLFLLSHLFVGYVPVPYNQRIGSSKIRLFRDGLRSLQIIVTAIARFNPLKLYLLLLFACWSGVLILFAASHFVPIAVAIRAALFASWIAGCLIVACAILALTMSQSPSNRTLLVSRAPLGRSLEKDRRPTAIEQL